MLLLRSPEGPFRVCLNFSYDNMVLDMGEVSAEIAREGGKGDTGR
jgi:hypothetical protein